MLRNIFLCAFAIVTLTACSGETFSGTWTIERAEPAPWVAADFVPDPALVNRYVGQTVSFGPNSISGPALLACASPQYAFFEAPAEGLFQGGLAESADAAAAQLGFAALPVHTMTTSCEHDIAFHMRDSNHAAFALDNMIFWMVRKP